MIFLQTDDYDGKTDYNAVVPDTYRHLLLPCFLHRFVTGSWGCYLSLWLEMEDFTLWLHHFFRLWKGRMLASVSETAYTINHMLAGRGFGVLNGGMPVELAPDRSHFFIIPADNYQYAILDKGYSLSMHVDFKRAYLDRNRQHYAALRPLLDQYDQHPEQAFYQSSVIHDYLTRITSAQTQL